MKKLFLLLSCMMACVATCTMNVHAQTKMHIWMQGGNIPFELTSVDSITFSGYAVEELNLSETSLSLAIGETYQLTASIPVERWQSSNPAIASVEDGLVTAIAEGTAIIAATTKGVTKTCVVTVVGPEAELDAYQLNRFGLFGSPTMIEGTERDIEMSSGAKYKCQLGAINLYAWDNNITFVNGTGFGGAGFFFETEVLIWWIIEDEYAGYYVGNGGEGFKIAPANPQDTIPYSGKSGELVDLQKYGDFWKGYLTLDEETATEAEIQALTQLYADSQTGTQIYRIDFDNGGQSYDLGNVTTAHFFENENDELQYTINIGWYDYVNEDRLFGLLIDEAGESIVEPYDMRIIDKEYTNIVETSAAAPAKKPAKAAVVGNSERLHLDANYAVEQVNNMKAKVQLHK